MYLISNITQETSPLCPLQQCNRKGSEKKCQNKHDPDVYLCFLSSLENFFVFFFFLAIFLIFKDGVKMIKKADKSKKLKRLSCLFPFLEKKKNPFIVLFPKYFKFWKKSAMISCISYVLWEKGIISKFQLLVSIGLQTHLSLCPPASVHSSWLVAVRPGVLQDIRVIPIDFNGYYMHPAVGE